MSLSAESLNLRRKRIATERATNNGDPLVARKKAREAVQPNVTLRMATTAAPAPKNGVNATNLRRRSSVHMEDDDDDNNLAPSSVPAPQRRTSVHIEEIDDDEDAHPRNVAPLNPSRLLELSDGSDDDEDLPGLVEVNDDDDDEDEEEPEESAEAELDRLSKDWNSPVYVFFKQMPSVEYINNRRVHVFECGATHCKGKGNGRMVRRYLDTGDAKSTSNLRKHAKICWGEEAVAAADNTRDVRAAREALEKLKLVDGSITAAFERVAKSKVTYSHRQHTTSEARAEIVRWIAESKRPFQIVNDRGFQSLMKTGRPGYQIPSAETVSRDMKRVFNNVRERIAKMLQEYEGALNFATDAWTSPNHKAYVAFTVHFEHEGDPMSMLLDLVEVAESHSGVNLANAFAKVLEDFGIEDKILSVTCDNASNNDTMIEHLSTLVENFPGAANQTRCFTHILNLVAKSILRQFEPRKKTGEGEEEDVDDATKALAALAQELELEEDVEVADDPEDGVDSDGVDGDEDLEVDDDDDDGLGDDHDGMSEEEVAELEESLVPIRLVLTKLRALANAIKNSSTIILPRWFAKLEELGLRVRMMPRDVSTRWNSTFDMLNFAIDYRPAIDAITSSRDLNLRKYELADNEWAIAVNLRDTLKIFKHATLFFSRDTPSISTVIPAMDHIDTYLATATQNLTYSPSIRAALAIGKATLNRYYNKTDYSEVYRIAMVLHPRHKLRYFKTAGWDDDWIDTAQSIVRDEFDRTYAFMDVDKEVNATTEPPSSSSTNIFDNLPALSTPATSELRDELDRYLSTDPEQVTDVCKWWYERKGTYPRLHRMALDYLTIPATSVDVERVFSQGRILLSHLRNRLSVQSTRAAMCVGVWSSLGYVKDSDIRAVVTLPAVPANAQKERLTLGWDMVL